MRIVVCIKQILDPKAPLELDEKGGDLVAEETFYITNPSDKVTVGEATRLKEYLGGVEVVLMSLGPASVERSLRECLALGADKAIRLACPEHAHRDLYSEVAILADSLKKLKPDLILCGAIGEDDMAGATGIMIAEVLNIPSISNVNKVMIEKERLVIVHRKLERGDREVMACQFPVLLTIEAGANNPIYAPLPSYMAAMTADIETWDVMTSYENKKPVLTTMSVTLPRPRLKKSIAIDSSLSPEARLKMLMSGGVTQKQSTLIEGNAMEIAEKILPYLIKAIPKFSNPEQT